MSITIEGNDDFDWEAAANEIDAACAKVAPFPLSFPSYSNDNCHRFSGDAELSAHHRLPSNGNDLIPDFELDLGCNSVEESTKPLRSSIQIDPEAAKTWIYPTNVPLRDYQFSITKTALFSNTLVALPTGLGKTLIAAVVMYNYFRWFPEGKIVFAAPSRPLVMQQIEACHNIVGISQELTIDLTGQINPIKRAELWKSKRVFFLTPQVLENDLEAGNCLVQTLVCLVIDEAHRAQGNYSYCVAVRELLKKEVQIRILALTATPGSKQPSVQSVIDNLNISTLEYRNENDPDVLPFVHNRKIELIEVPLGKEATNANKLLLDVIRPLMTKLSSMGMHVNRDCQTVSPPDLLKLRDKFRVAPPPDLCHSKYGEVEGYFGCLITLLHIRKLLVSHGLKPAYDMLEEKLKQGSFARLMLRNEKIISIRLLMNQKLFHGAHSPKLSKMLEILVDHFKEKDPQSSRVIIFSNYRGSVRVILDTLSTIKELVKAAEFIGQSSGRHKGQSQKMQQAVLQKFRDGGYNVIVATSIGEEGLDIMEVDLVMCFDANVSPLRMIQRMGRTGRKNNGRVVVLACEGSELKGYLRKQASGRSMKKLLHNGGINSFNFHPSSRMIPHCLKPEVHYVEFFIKQYIPRGKEEKNYDAGFSSSSERKLTFDETNLLKKYFNPNKLWKPSLIVFPQSQTLPCEPFRVKHSFRTDLFIQSMKFLRGLSKLEAATAHEQLNHVKDPQDAIFSIELNSLAGEKDNFNTPVKGCIGYDSHESSVVPESPNMSPQSNGEIVPESPPDVSDTSNREELKIHEPPKLGFGILRKVQNPVIENAVSPLVDLSNKSNSENWLLSSRKQPPKFGFGILRRVQKPVIEHVVSPLVDSTNKSSSEDWLLSSQKQPPRPLKRLRRASGLNNERFKIKRRKKKSIGECKALIDDEADVCSSGDQSPDEEERESSYDDSFIDDRISPTPGSCEVDMQGIYRRSLLSQSPYVEDKSKLNKDKRKRKLDFVSPSNNDDQFFDDIDLDALEKQATYSLPSFNLGI